MSIIINGQEVSAQVYDDYTKRTDVFLKQISPSVYITVTQADIMTHSFVVSDKETPPIALPLVVEVIAVESKPTVEVVSSKKKGRIIMEGGENNE